MGFTCGIIGLPNVGKSSIFNALTSAKAASANFPFCTIEPNTGAVPVPDNRLEILANLAGSQKLIPTQVTFVDIAGLIKGASQGEGLGNQFLGHIRSVDAVAHVVRCFGDDNIIHVEGSVDPIRDIETIETELILSDYEYVTKQIARYEKLSRAGDKIAKEKISILTTYEKDLAQGKPSRFVEIESQMPEVLEEIKSQLLTSKPVLFVANVDEGDVNAVPKTDGDRALDRVYNYAQKTNSRFVLISGKVESEIAELPKEEREEYLAALDIKESGLDRLAIAGYQLLNLISFFTIGPKEAHAWTAPKGTLAPQCAGKIHSDFEKGFIRAEIISYDDYITAGSEVKVKENGKLRVEGKEYIMQDGDIVHFRFNV